MNRAIIIIATMAACSDGATPHDQMVNNHGLDGGSVEGDAPIDGANAVLASTPVVSFGTVLVNTESAMAVAITNTGGASEISNLAISGSGAYLISSDSCIGSTVTSTAGCDVHVAFAPTTAGVTDATLAVTGTANGSTMIVLKGTGANAGALGFTPTSGAFGNVTAATTADVVLQLQNVGTTATGAISVEISGPDAAFFVRTASNCGGGLAASATCSVTVRFSPQNPGARSATLSATDAYGGAMTAALTGTGI